MANIAYSARVRHAVEHAGRSSGVMWVFRTKRFEIRWEVEPDHAYRYDGDDADGEVQAKIDSGEYVAFDSKMIVELDGVEIAADHLGGSVYENPAEFRDHIGMNARGHGSYFSDMVREAVNQARKHLQDVPRLRSVS